MAAQANAGSVPGMGQWMSVSREKLTPLRREILDLIKAANRPVKAYDLIATLSRKRGAVAPPTVYRVLGYLLEHGHIHRIESLNAFALCSHAPATADHAFLICDSCGSASEVCSSDAADALKALCTRRGFAAEQMSLEVHGQCRSCKGRHVPAG